MMRCRKMRGQMAASVYDELDPQEQRELEAHLEQCPDCRAQNRALRQVASSISVAAPAYQGNLLPALQARLAERRHLPASPHRVRYALVGAMGMLIVLLTVFGAIQGSSAPPPRVVLNAPLSPVEHALARADGMVRNGDYTGAYGTLTDAVEEHADDPRAGVVQKRLADLAFARLHWYQVADEAYDRLARDHNAVFVEDELNILRRNVLHEARRVNYASLYELDAACYGGKSLDQLARVVGRYPGTQVASMGVREMTRIVMNEQNLAETDRNLARAMEMAREQCEDATAAAQLNMELANHYWDAMRDEDRARDLLDRVVESGDQALTGLARQALARLDSPTGDVN